ncbi:MAG: hypothetical protein ACOYW3_13470 [Bacteroidota bacterium]
MMEEELIKIWQSSPNQESIKYEKSRLMLEVHASLDKFHKAVKYRDLREQIAVAVIVPFFAVGAFILPGTMSKIACVLIIAWAFYVLYRLREAKKSKPGAFSDPYLDYLYRTREYLHVQKHLLDNVMYWYILPAMFLTMLFTVGFGIADRIRPIVKMAVLNIGLAVATYILNKRAVAKQIMPRLNKVNELIQVMEKQ